MRTEDLTTYCGGYCGQCARWKDNATFTRLASAMAELADAHGFQYWMPNEVKEFDYREFRKALDFFSNKDGWLICKKGCKQGDGNPYCEIRNCCQKHGINLCFECSEFPCDMIRKDKKVMERAREYKELGKEKWLQHQKKKGKKGFEDHTKKYYTKTISMVENEEHKEDYGVE